MTPGKVRLGTSINIRQTESTSLLLAWLLLSLMAMPAAHAQTFAVLHNFAGNGDGALPLSGVIVDPKGNLYGVTEDGGSFDYGTLFSLAATEINIVHNFVGSDGLYPEAGLLEDSAGNLYGTATDGGTDEGGGCFHGCGVIFKRDPSGTQTVLHAFTGQEDGGSPNSPLIQDSAGNFYGTTFAGGITSCEFGLGCGVIYKLDATGAFSVLYSFTGMTDGYFPEGLVLDAAGNLYTTTYAGGAYRYGAIVKLDTAGVLSVLYSFTGSTDGNDPAGSLVIDQAGNLYGTTFGVYVHGFGEVYKLDTSGNLTVLHTFTTSGNQTPVGGAYPEGLVMDSAGNLYGVTLGGGTGTNCYYGSCGLVFKLDTSNNFSVLHSFSGGDGQLPTRLTMDKSGTLYGTTEGGGLNGQRQCSYYKGCGVVFKLTL
jgi:uncharacterized repeat protein (TIGR03803 family)